MDLIVTPPLQAGFIGRFSLGGPGTKPQPTFALSLNDLGSGAVDTSVSRGVGPATFTRATAATCWSSAGLLLTVATGVARSNYTELTGASYLGYLAEVARTNNCIWNRDFTNAAWVATTMTKALDQVGIDGAANSASSLLATGANSTVKQTITIAAVNRPFSVYIKRITGSGNVDLAQDGSTYTTQTLGASWTRCTLVASQLNPILSIRLVTSGDKIAVDYAALEDEGGAAATFPSTPIATTTVAVTRNADVLTYPSSGNAGTAQGTVYAEITSLVPDISIVNFFPMSISDGSTSNDIELASGGTAARFLVNSSGLQADITVGTIIYGVPFKQAGSWNTNYAQIAKDGVLGTSDTAVVAPATFNTIYVGRRYDTAGSSKAIKNIRIWQRQLPDGVLQQMTT